MSHFGAAEGRDPNRFFDGAWYVTHYPDVGGFRVCIRCCIICKPAQAELRNPHPRFDAAYYADEHPEAAGNPLLYHLLFGVDARLADRKAGRDPRLYAEQRGVHRPRQSTLWPTSSSRFIGDWRRRSVASTPCWPMPIGRMAMSSSWMTARRNPAVGLARPDGGRWTHPTGA